MILGRMKDEVNKLSRIRWDFFLSSEISDANQEPIFDS